MWTVPPAAGSPLAPPPASCSVVPPPLQPAKRIAEVAAVAIHLVLELFTGNSARVISPCWSAKQHTAPHSRSHRPSARADGVLCNMVHISVMDATPIPDTPPLTPPPPADTTEDARC